MGETKKSRFWSQTDDFNSDISLRKNLRYWSFKDDFSRLWPNRTHNFRVGMIVFFFSYGRGNIEMTKQYFLLKARKCLDKKAIAIPHSKWNSKIFKNCEISKDMLYEVSCPFSKYSVKIQNELLTVFQFKIWLLRHARAFNSIYRRNYWRKSGFVTSRFPLPYYGSITISRCITFKLKWQLVICINVQMLVYGTKNGIGEISLILDRISTF